MKSSLDARSPFIQVSVPEVSHNESPFPVWKPLSKSPTLSRWFISVNPRPHPTGSRFIILCISTPSIRPHPTLPTHVKFICLFTSFSTLHFFLETCQRRFLRSPVKPYRTRFMESRPQCYDLKRKTVVTQVTIRLPQTEQCYIYEKISVICNKSIPVPVRKVWQQKESTGENLGKRKILNRLE